MQTLYRAAPRCQPSFKTERLFTTPGKSEKTGGAYVEYLLSRPRYSVREKLSSHSKGLYDKQNNGPYIHRPQHKRGTAQEQTVSGGYSQFSQERLRMPPHPPCIK